MCTSVASGADPALSGISSPTGCAVERPKSTSAGHQGTSSHVWCPHRQPGHANAECTEGYSCIISLLLITCCRYHGCTGYHACRRCSTRGFTGKFGDLEVFEQYVCVLGCKSLIVIQHLFEIYVCACSASKSPLPRQTDQQLKRNEKSLFGIAVARTQTVHL